MLLLGRPVYQGFHHDTCPQESQIHTKQHHLQQNDIIAEDLHLAVVLPCDLCPHHYHRDLRLLWESYGCGGDEWLKGELIEENLTDEELEAVAQLMELSSQSLPLAEETSNSFVAEGIESSAISDSRQSCPFTLLPHRAIRNTFNVDIDERLRPRTRSVNEIFKQSSTSRKRRRGLQVPA
ncbi:hypothetical protein SUGI_0501800 [Cryptomeria japonica]|uniref:uncharacterized protein LOC131035573 n=1 Tax=Cryptomeria japonica TaxID=3369 RepID=UPI002408E265|nr:uncharacterized protein LOC131035573 [Cryptomeria japonica]GLJ26165.1 hypothetical protein SUGI_0501800 [Cryptomeria japonica]